MTPTQDVLKTLMHLKEDKQWKGFVDWLKWERDDAARAAGHMQDDVLSRWTQGHMQLLEMLLDVIDKAEARLVKQATAKDNSGVF